MPTIEDPRMRSAESGSVNSGAADVTRPAMSKETSCSDGCLCTSACMPKKSGAKPKAKPKANNLETVAMVKRLGMMKRTRQRNLEQDAQHDDRNLPGLTSVEYDLTDAEEVRADPENGRYYTKNEMVRISAKLYSKEQAEEYWAKDCKVVDRAKPPPAGQDWFSNLCGFQETSYLDTKHWLRVEPAEDGRGQMIVSKVNEKKYAVGTFTTPRLDTLRARVAKVQLPGKLTVSNELGDVAEKHSDEENCHATFQVASQFNCLEFTHPRAMPQDGVTQYSEDRTQGPACSVACGPATIFRNFYARMHAEGRPKQYGQTADCMIDNLCDVSEVLGNVNECLYTVAGGYSLCDREQMTKLNEVLYRLRDDGYEDYIHAALRIGVHDDVEVTATHWGRTLIERPQQTVTQVFGSALAVAYNKRTTQPEDWESFATTLLEASYEATLCAGILAANRHGGQAGSRRVFLTSLGGGVFGNSMDWIEKAIRRACDRYKTYDLDVRIVTYAGEVHDKLQQLEKDFRP